MHTTQSDSTITWLTFVDRKVTQHEPVWLDLEGTVQKTIKIIEEAAQAKAKLVAFPECWIPGYPAWIW
jgi:predicted amidohydrolase